MAPSKGLTVEELARAVLKVSQTAPKYSLDALEKSEKAPYGFMAAVQKEIPHVPKTTIQYHWQHEKSEILAEVKRLAESDIDDTVDSLVANDTRATHDSIAESGSTPEKVIDDTSDTMTRKEILTVIHEMEARLTSMIQAQQRPVVIGDKDEPPPQAKQGKKFLGARADLRVKLDAALMDRLKALEPQYAGNLSRVLDVIVWRGLDRPAMSYELPEDEQARLRKKYQK